MKITELVSHFSISLILILVLLSGCVDTSVGDDPNDRDPDDPLPVGNLSFSDHIQPIFSSRCASCHGAQGLSGVSLNNYNNLMSSVGDCYDKNIVIPEERTKARLSRKFQAAVRNAVSECLRVALFFPTNRPRQFEHGSKKERKTTEHNFFVDTTVVPVLINF